MSFFEASSATDDDDDSGKLHVSIIVLFASVGVVIVGMLCVIGRICGGAIYEASRGALVFPQISWSPTTPPNTPPDEAKREDEEKKEDTDDSTMTGSDDLVYDISFVDSDDGALV